MAGLNHSGLLTCKGHLYLFGNNEEGQIGNGSLHSEWEPVLLENILVDDVFISANTTFIVVEGHQIYAFGHNHSGFFGIDFLILTHSDRRWNQIQCLVPCSVPEHSFQRYPLCQCWYFPCLRSTGKDDLVSLCPAPVLLNS